MDVRRASGSVHAFVGQELGELTGKKFACIVAVQGAHHSSWRLASLIEECCEPGEEASDVLRGFVFVPHHVDGFKSRVVVYDDECVAASSVDGGEEWSRYVYVNESVRVRRLVKLVKVR
eukprot:6181572-Pleurochrysis_carterae.AAC.1